MPASHPEILASLKKSRYLATVPEKSLKNFLPLIRQAHFIPGQRVISQGETNQEVFIILKGRVIVKTDQRLLYTLGRTGDIFGEISVVNGQPSTASIEVDEKLEALVVSAALLKEVKNNSSHELSFLFYDWVSRILADKLYLTSEKAKKFEDASADLRESLRVQQQISENLRQTACELEKSKTELEDLNNLKSEMLGIASHDLRSPISSVITVMEIIPTCYDLDAELVELLKEVKDTCHEQLTLVNDLLDLAKIESGRLELETTNFSYPQLLEIFGQIEKRARLLLRNKQLQVSFEIAAGLTTHTNPTAESPFICFDIPKIQQVLNNLIGNAVKFTPDKGSIRLRLDRSTDQHLLVSVSDSGGGIPLADQAQVFDKFHQVKKRKTGTRGEKGSGLGLAICKNMVELHRGQIWVESVDGAGSTFTFSLPLSQHQEQGQAVASV